MKRTSSQPDVEGKTITDRIKAAETTVFVLEAEKPQHQHHKLKELKVRVGTGIIAYFLAHPKTRHEGFMLDMYNTITNEVVRELAYFDIMEVLSHFWKTQRHPLWTQP